MLGIVLESRDNIVNNIDVSPPNISALVEFVSYLATVEC